jgi:phospholipase/carboxylesterase
LRFDLSRTVFLGYSNGANLVTSVMLLHPGIISRAVLLRAMPVLDNVPDTDLSATRILSISGVADVTYAPFAPALSALLRRHGAEVEDRVAPAGHEFGEDDAALARDWLTRLYPTSSFSGPPASAASRR